MHESTKKKKILYEEKSIWQFNESLGSSCKMPDISLSPRLLSRLHLLFPLGIPESFQQDSNIPQGFTSKHHALQLPLNSKRNGRSDTLNYHSTLILKKGDSQAYSAITITINSECTFLTFASTIRYSLLVFLNSSYCSSVPKVL